jgi:uncharacterized membrane protein
MPDERQINKKLEELLRDSEESNKDMEEVLFTERSELKDMDDQEVKEVKDALEKMFKRKEAIEDQKPKPIWKWKFYGVWLAQALLFLIEFLFLVLSIYFLVPLSINTSMTFIQAFSSGVLLTILRQWKK